MSLRRDVLRLAARGGDLAEVRAALDGALRRAVGCDAVVISTLDPATNLWTSCYVSGLAPDPDRSRERAIFDVEFLATDLNSYHALSGARLPVGRLHAATGGDLTRSRRYERVLAPLGVVDELRGVLRTRGACWGTLTLYRTGSGVPFGTAEEQTVGEASEPMADLVRLTLLRAALAAPRSVEAPPGVLVVAADGSVESISDSAGRWLEDLDDRGRLPSAITSVVAATRAGERAARAALPSRSGRWIVLHGSTVGDDGTTSVIIEGARPAELGRVIAEAHGFTSREREVTALAARGRTTRQMARELGISPFTVQDHLKSVFAKTGAQTRGELVAIIFSTHYEPRNDAGCTPGPYGWYLDDELTPAV